MPELSRSDLIGMSYEVAPPPRGLAKVRVEGRYRRRTRTKEILVWANLTGPDSLRREVEQVLDHHLFPTYLDAGRLTVDRQGQIGINGKPDEILDVPIVITPEFLTHERDRTKFQTEKIAGRYMPVSARTKS